MNNTPSEKLKTCDYVSDEERDHQKNITQLNKILSEHDGASDDERESNNELESKGTRIQTLKEKVIEVIGYDDFIKYHYDLKTKVQQNDNDTTARKNTDNGSENNPDQIFSDQVFSKEDLVLMIGRYNINALSFKNSLDVEKTEKLKNTLHSPQIY